MNAPLPILEHLRRATVGIGGGLASVGMPGGTGTFVGARQIWAARTDSGGVSARTDATNTITNTGSDADGNPVTTTITTIGQLGTGNAYEAAPYVDSSGNVQLRVSTDTMKVWNLSHNAVAASTWVILEYVFGVPVVVWEDCPP